MARRSYGSSSSAPKADNKVVQPASKPEKPELNNNVSVVEPVPSSESTEQSSSPKRKRRTYGSTSVSKPVLDENVQSIGKSDKTPQNGQNELSEANNNGNIVKNKSEVKEKGKKVTLKPKEKKPLTKRQKRRRLVFATIAFIFLIVLSVGGYFFYKYYKRDADIAKMWDAVRDEANIDDKTKLGGEDGYSKDPFDREIDWDALLAINPDVKCWIYIPGTNIDYPVLQEQTMGEFFYLNHDIYKNYSYMGCILCCKEPEGWDDKEAHLVFYGHKMLGKQMFGNLDLYKSADFGNSNPYVYVYYPDRTERWSVWSTFHTDKDDMIYEMPYEIGTVGYKDLIDHIDSNKLYKTQSGTPDELENTLTLSTCDNPNGGHNGRFTVSCRITNQKKDIKWFNTDAQAEKEKKQNEIRREKNEEEQKKIQKDYENGDYYDVYTIEYNSDEE